MAGFPEIFREKHGVSLMERGRFQFCETFALVWATRTLRVMTMSSLWIRAKRMATNTLSAATYSSPRTAAKSYRVRLNDSPIACTAVQLWLHARTGIALAVERANDQTRKPRERAPTVFEFSHCLMDFTVQWLRNTHVKSARSPIDSCRGISSAHSFRRSI